MIYSTHRNEMVSSGYRMIPPSTQAGVMDAEVVKSIPCGECGGEMTYYPFFRQTPCSYRPVAFCNSCKNWEEF